MPKILAFGTFDIFHSGHLAYLKQAREIAKDGELIVIVARDKNVKKFKNKKPLNSEKDRLEIIRHLKIVDRAVLGKENNIFTLVKQIKPDIILLGYDQKPSEEELEKKLDKLNIKSKIMRAKPYNPHKMKSTKIHTKIREKILNEH